MAPPENFLKGLKSLCTRERADKDKRMRELEDRHQDQLGGKQKKMSTSSQSLLGIIGGVVALVLVLLAKSGVLNDAMRFFKRDVSPGIHLKQERLQQRFEERNLLLETIESQPSRRLRHCVNGQGLEDECEPDPEPKPAPDPESDRIRRLADDLRRLTAPADPADSATPADH